MLTQCFTHSLNLAVGDAIKTSKVMKNSLETRFEIQKLKDVAETRWQVGRYQNRLEQEEVNDVF